MGSLVLKFFEFQNKDLLFSLIIGMKGYPSLFRDASLRELTVGECFILNLDAETCMEVSLMLRAFCALLDFLIDLWKACQWSCWILVVKGC